MISFVVNGKEVHSEQPGDTPLLWVIREELGLTGTKFGCGIAQCGACTVHVNGNPVRSCSTPVSSAQGKKITTIEGLAPAGDHPLQKAWVAGQVPQRQMLPSMCLTICSRVGLLLVARSAAACMICPDWQ